MPDKEHEEWLRDEALRKELAKRHKPHTRPAHPPVDEPPPPGAEPEEEDDDDDEDDAPEETEES